MRYPAPYTPPQAVIYPDAASINLGAYQFAEDNPEDLDIISRAGEFIGTSIQYASANNPLRDAVRAEIFSGRCDDYIWELIKRKSLEERTLKFENQDHSYPKNRPIKT